MFTLIKREIYDHIAYFVGALAFSFIIISIMLFALFAIDPEDMSIQVFGFSTPFTVLFLFGSTGMGVSQMYFDRNKKISAFLSTLAVTRDRILIARISAGILAILLFFMPLIITTMVLYGFFMSPVPVLKNVLFDVFTVSLLMSLVCYCIGLQTGWTTRRLIPSLGGLLLTCIFLTLIIVKGFSNYILLLLVLFIIASLIRIGQKFISTSL